MPGSEYTTHLNIVVSALKESCFVGKSQCHSIATCYLHWTNAGSGEIPHNLEHVVFDELFKEKVNECGQNCGSRLLK